MQERTEKVNPHRILMKEETKRLIKLEVIPYRLGVDKTKGADYLRSLRLNGLRRGMKYLQTEKLLRV